MSDDSFFENSEIDFINDEFTGKVESKMSIVLLSPEAPDNGYLYGFVKILASNGLKDGKFIMRFCSVQEVTSDSKRLMVSNSIEQEIAHLKKIERNKSTLMNVKKAFMPFGKGAVVAKLQKVEPLAGRSLTLGLNKSQNKSLAPQTKKDLMMKKLLREVFNQPRFEFNIAKSGEHSGPQYHSKQFDLKPTTVGAIGSDEEVKEVAPQAEALEPPPSSIRFESPNQQQFSTKSNTIYCKELDLFTLERTIDKQVILIIPFSVELEGNIGESCEYKFSFAEPDLQNVLSPSMSPKKRSFFEMGMRPRRETICIKDVSAKSFKTKKMKIRIPLDFETKEMIKVLHKLECYYITNAGFKGFKREEHPLDFDSLEFFRDTAGFIHAESIITIRKNPRAFARNKKLEQISIVEYKYGIHLRCFLKKYLLQLYLDKTCLSQEDVSISLVMSFSPKLLAVIKNVDIIIYCENEFYSDQLTESHATSSHIRQTHWIMRDTFDILENVPKNPTDRSLEFVGVVDLSKIRHKLQTIVTPRSKINFFIKIYFSKKPFSFSREILTQELIFFTSYKSFSTVSAELKREFFKGLLKQSDKSSSIVQLPFSEIKLSHDYSKLVDSEEYEKRIELSSQETKPDPNRTLPLVTKTMRGKDTIDLDSNSNEMAILARELIDTSQEDKAN